MLSWVDIQNRLWLAQTHLWYKNTKTRVLKYDVSCFLHVFFPFICMRMLRLPQLILDGLNVKSAG